MHKMLLKLLKIYIYIHVVVILVHVSALQGHLQATLFKDSNSLHKQKLRGFSPPANYTDRATAACRRS
jgi:hypothetical protein